MAAGRSTRLARCCALLVFFVVLTGVAAAGSVPEPESYWLGPMRGDVPATLAHGHVIHTQELADLLARSAPLLIDVAERPRRPEGLAANVWKPASHRDIPGSVWLPGVGLGVLDAAVLNSYQTRLAALADGDFGRAIVVYCHARCWGSWNAAKRAIAFGYRNIYWYPEGVEGWQDAGRELAVVRDAISSEPDR